MGKNRCLISKHPYTHTEIRELYRVTLTTLTTLTLSQTNRVETSLVRCLLVRHYQYMIDFNIKTTGVDKALAQLEAVAPKQIPFILALSLTETARDVEFVLKREMQRRIDRPRQFTINSLFATRATKSRLEAQVRWKDFAGKGTPGGKYLRPIAEGGARSLKRSESALKRRGILPSGFYLAPGEGAKLDANGNVSGNVVTQMLSYLKAFGEQGYVANRNNKRKTKTQWFAIRPGEGTKLPPGIYQRVGSGFRIIFAMVKAPTYKVVFPFSKITTDVGKQQFPIRFNEAIVRALSTAKK
jgi:hypothetical protein